LIENTDQRSKDYGQVSSRSRRLHL
jgi:hypothetical protein